MDAVQFVNHSFLKLVQEISGTTGFLNG